MAKVGYAIVTVILVSGLFSFWQEYRVEQTLAALRKLLPQQAQVLREGKVTRVPAEQLVPGDIVHLEQGDNIPADCRLIEAFGARVNNAVVTGESLPKAREADPSDVDDLIHSKNVVLAGTSLVSGQAKAVVFATGMHTEFGKIAHLTQTAVEEVSPLRKEIAHLSRLTIILAVLIGLLFFSLGWMIGIPFWKAFIFAIGIIVAMVPEGLLPTLTLALVLATQRMAKRNVLIRYLPSVETLGSTTVICTDKTGTLTQNHMMVRRLYLGETFDSPAGVKQKPDFADLYRPFFQAARMCHDLKETESHGKPAFRDADRERVSMQKRHTVGLFNRIFWQYADYFRRDIGNCYHPTDQLYALGKFSSRYGSNWRGGLGFCHSFRGRHVNFGRAAQMVCTQKVAQSFFPEWSLNPSKFRFEWLLLAQCRP